MLMATSAYGNMRWITQETGLRKLFSVSPFVTLSYLSYHFHLFHHKKEWMVYDLFDCSSEEPSLLLWHSTFQHFPAELYIFPIYEFLYTHISPSKWYYDVFPFTFSWKRSFVSNIPDKGGGEPTCCVTNIAGVELAANDWKWKLKVLAQRL